MMIIWILVIPHCSLFVMNLYLYVKVIEVLKLSSGLYIKKIIEETFLMVRPWT